MRKPSLLERLRSKKKARSTVVGVTWYTEEDWSKVKAAATDPERFEGTYSEWNAMAVEAVADLKKVGVNTVKFFVIPNELLPWCLAHNKPNNAASRAEFVSEKLRAQSEADA
jgi:methylthioribose-1-phosphate isomerase